MSALNQRRCCDTVRAVRPSLAFSALALAACIAAGGAAAADEICPPLAAPALALPSWAEDTAYELDVRKLPDGRLALHVVGDSVVLDAQQFASLVRTVGLAPSNVAELLIDAREVRIAAPLAFDAARIRIVAHSVVFERQGAIVLINAPSGRSDGLEISAERLDLSQTMPVPLQVSVGAGRSGRQVAIQVASLVLRTGDAAGQDAAEALWRLSSNFDGRAAAVRPSGWRVKIGGHGKFQARPALKAAAWPGFTAAKLRKHHGIAPFDVGHRQELQARVAALHPFLEQLGHADVLRDMEAVGLLMAQGVDRRGRGPAWVPSKDFMQAHQDFELRLSRAEATLRRQADEIVAAYGAPRVDGAALDGVRTRLSELAAAQHERAQQISATLTRLEALRQELGQVHQAIAVERARSKADHDYLVRERKERLAVIQGATTVVAIGATLLAPPAAGAVIGAAASTAGELVYQHNAGGKVDMDTIVAAAKNGAELHAKLDKVRKSWDEHRRTMGWAGTVFDGRAQPGKDGKLPTKLDAAKGAGQSAMAFAQGVKGVADAIATQPLPQSVTLEGVEASNQALQAHLARLGSLQTTLVQQAQRLTRLQEVWARDTAAAAEAQVLEQGLRDAAPSNSLDAARWKAAARRLYAQTLEGLYDEAGALARSLQLESGRRLDLSAMVAQYPIEAVAYLGRLDVRIEALDRPGLQQQARIQMNHDIGRHLLALRAISDATRTAWEQHKVERAAGIRPYVDSFLFTDGDDEPSASRAFVQALNALIRQQVQSADAAPVQLLIPFTETRPPQPDLPLRVLEAGVADVRFKTAPAPGQQLYFDISYLRTGTLQRGGQCFFVDFSEPGLQATATTHRVASVPLQAAQARAQVPLTFEDIGRSSAVAPARTSYVISITVGGHPGTGSVPEIQQLTFWRKLVQ